MKKLLLSLVAMMVATVCFAQSHIATLSHGGKIKTFYGRESFKSAMDAADNGDIITLSSGQFEAAGITKAITLRGSGMVERYDSVGYHAPTIIQGKLNIVMEDSTMQTSVSIEGVKFNDFVYCKNLNNPIFTKCNLYGIGNVTGSNYNVRNAILINCRVRYCLFLTDNSTATCINSVINRPYSEVSNVNTSFEFINCVLTDIRNQYYGSSTDYKSYLTYSSFRNCYLSFNTNYITNTGNNRFSTSLSSTNLVTNCYSTYSDAFKNYSNTTNKVLSEYPFKSFAGGSWNDTEKFELTTENATALLGDDGTQIGIYGGNIPYDELISMPYITKCNVAGKSTSDGKLSVDIEVNVKQ